MAIRARHNAFNEVKLRLCDATSAQRSCNTLCILLYTLPITIATERVLRVYDVLPHVDPNMYGL